MKKLVACIVLLLSLTILAAPTETIKKILAISAEKVLSGPVVEKIIDCVVENNDFNSSLRFDSVYHDIRAEFLYQEDVSPLVNESSGGPDWYWAGRALFVSKVKGYLHDGTNLVDFYKNHYRHTFKQKLEDLDLGKKMQIREKIQKAIALFSTLKVPLIKNKFITFQKAEEAHTSQADLRLLGRNINEQELAGEIEKGALDTREAKMAAESAFISMFDDSDFAKFAGRRAVEGGDALLDKYIELLALMAEDAQ